MPKSNFLKNVFEIRDDEELVGPMDMGELRKNWINFIHNSEEVTQDNTGDFTSSASHEWWGSSQVDYVETEDESATTYFLLEGNDWMFVNREGLDNTVITAYGWTGRDSLYYIDNFGREPGNITTAYINSGALGYIYENGNLKVKFADFESYSFDLLYAQQVKVYGSEDGEKIQAGSNSSSLHGYGGDDHLVANMESINAYLYGGEGDDWLESRDGITTFDGGRGADYMEGTLSSDGSEDFKDTVKMTNYYGGGVRVTFESATSNTSKMDYRQAFFSEEIDTGINMDVFHGTSTGDYFYGNDIDHDFHGNGGSDHMYGGRGNEYMTGGSGNDHISGGEGNDSMRGDSGNDIFIFEENFGRDYITDFTDDGSSEDKLDFSAYGFTSFAEFEENAIIAQSGANAVISFNIIDYVVLIDVNVANLSNEDFILA